MATTFPTTTADGGKPADTVAKPNSFARIKALGVTPRALFLGLLFTVLVDLWIHYAELIMGGVQGHTAIAATSTPVGAVCILLMLSGINLLCRYLLPGFELSAAELCVVYSMLTTATVLSSSGQLHFIVPTVAAVWHYANDANAWAGLFERFVPHWMAQTDTTVLDGFYKGQTYPDWLRWAPQMSAWIGFTFALSIATLCIVAILRRQWVDRERLAFPTVALPLALMEEKAPIFRNTLFWIGAAIPFAFCVTNTLALNIPQFPLVSLRADVDLQSLLTTPPFNHMGRTAYSFYPFVVGIAYLIPVDVTFSAWFFFFLTRIENLFGALFNIDAGITGSNKATFPFLSHQGAGAFLGLTIVSLWLSRGYFKEIWKNVVGDSDAVDDSDEPLPYRWAFVGLLISVVAMIVFCVAAGMQPVVAILLIVLALMYMIAATRIRAETGNAWLFGPEVDVNTLMTRTFGTSLLTPQDLTILAFMRPAVSNFDMRCLPMPHQFDAFKMADTVATPSDTAFGYRRRLLGAIVIGTLFGLIVTWGIALTFWHSYGAEAKTDAWRTSMGRVPFDNLASLLRNPVPADTRGIGALAFGFVFTAFLLLMRTRFVWWSLHPVGYAMANTGTLETTWLPFVLAWGIKVLVLRYGGAALYRRSIPFFLGLIAGDLLGGGLTTAIGAFTGINVYPINW